MEPFERVLELLNRLHKLDPSAAQALVTTRTRVNPAVVADPELVVEKLGRTDVMTPLGFLNAVLADDGVVIVAQRDTNQVITGFTTRRRVSTDGNPLGAIAEFVRAAWTTDTYVRGRPGYGDRVLIMDEALEGIRRSDGAWQRMVAVGKRYGKVVANPDGAVRIRIGEDLSGAVDIDVPEEHVRMHPEDWQARYGHPPAT